jgi:hypothetical protein
VVWDENPLSINARAVRTYVEGECLYSLEQDLILRKAIQTERARITQKMVKAGSEEGALRKPSEKIRTHYHCDTETEENN